MTVSNSQARHVYVAGEGATPPYPIDFPFHENGHVAVTHRGADGVETPWLEGSHYTLEAAPDGSGGTLTVLAGHELAAGESLVIARAVPLTQEADYQEAGRFPAETHERALDKLTMITQQLAEALGRTLAVPTTDQAPGLELPIDADRAGRFLAFDGEGRPVAALGTSADLTPVSAFINGLLDDGDAASARATLGLYGLDLDPTSALPWRIFTVTGASAAFNDSQTGSGGEGATVDHDISWMDGLWIATNLYWDAAYGILSRYETHKDDPALAIHLGTNGFPDIIGGFSAIAHFRVQGTAAATAAGNEHKGGLPDRLVWPAAGSVGGVEMGEIWTTQGQRAAGGSTSEMDGDGASHAYNRRVHIKLSDDGSTAVWFSGFVSNSFAAGDAVDFAAHPSVRWGLRQTLDVSSGNPASYTTTKVEYVIQYAAPTGGVPDWHSVTSMPIGNDISPNGGALLFVRDEKPANTAGGTFTQGAWRTRTLNTVQTNEIPGAALNSNQISLPSGTYLIEARAPCSNVGNNRLRLFNVTDAEDLIVGGSMTNGATPVIDATLRGQFALDSEKNLELQHYCGSTQATTGFGVAVNVEGKAEVYTEVFIRQLAS